MGNILVRLRASWKVSAAVLAALLIGSALGAGATSSSQNEASSLQADLIQAQEDLLSSQQESSDLLTENQELSSDLESSQDDLEELQQDYDYTTRNLSKLEAKLETKLAEADEALADANAHKESLRKQEAAARELRRRLDKELGLIVNSKFGDGVWRVGGEITPGIYRAPAGASCYWAILNSADTSDISNNGGFTANQTVTLTAGHWFETSDCGQWKKIG